jgi:enediyne biosynthesis protein E4
MGFGNRTSKWPPIRLTATPIGITVMPDRFPYMSFSTIRLAALALLALSGFTASAQLTGRDLVQRTNAIKFLLERRDQEINAAKQLRSFHDFRFTDRFQESGITFRHQAVADANKDYKPVHYDHGTGLAVADVDGDGRFDVYFVNQLGQNELWRNLGNGKFQNITAKAGVGMDGKISVSASFGDIDNDGDPDLFVTSVRFGNKLFENLGGARFKDITAAAGVGFVGHSSGAVFLDFDNDGLLDLFVCNIGRYTTDARGPGGYYVGVTNAFQGHLFPDRAEQSILYHNLGKGKFADVSKEMNLQDMSWSGDATFADLNGDGFPDLYVLNMQGDDHYYENQQGKRFVEKTASLFPKTPWGAMGVKFFDFNQDGRMDLFVTDMHSDMSNPQIRLSKSNARLDFEEKKSEAWCFAQWSDEVLQGASNNIFGNAFYINKGGGRFDEVSDDIGAETLWPWGISVGDLNADGYEDVFVTAGMGIGYRYVNNSILLNDNGQKFAHVEFVLGVEPRLNDKTHKVSYVLDCSGEDKDSPYCAGRNGKVPVFEALSSRSSAVFDMDDDGDLDIITNEMNDRPQVLASNLSERKKIHFLKIKLVGTKSNRDGLGSLVKVNAGGKTLTQYHDGKLGYLSQSSAPLYFGLGDAARTERIEVKWPSGKTQIVRDEIPVNGILTIKESN